MNIVKFKDIMADPMRTYGAIFNEKFRGKYTYWIHCRYIVALEDIELNQAIEFELHIEDLFISEIQYIDIREGLGVWIYDEGYIDETETSKINSVNSYIISNSFVPEDITIDKLRNFRTWLAENLLIYKGELTDNQRHVLDYYAGGMTDNTIKWLTEFGGVNVQINSIIGVPSCGCGTGTNVSSLYNNGTAGLCDPIAIYRGNIHIMMVEMFSNIDFWNDLDNNFLQEIILYIQGIIDSGLSLVKDTTQLSGTFSCKCLNVSDSAQLEAQNLLRELIVVLNRMIQDDLDGHKLNSTTVLSRWADELYEIMQWD